MFTQWTSMYKYETKTVDLKSKSVNQKRKKWYTKQEQQLTQTIQYTTKFKLSTNYDWIHWFDDWSLPIVIECVIDETKQQQNKLNQIKYQSFWLINFCSRKTQTIVGGLRIF